MTDDLRAIAQAYKAAACQTWADGTRHDWRYHGAPELYRLMLAICEYRDRVQEELDALRARVAEVEAMPEVIELLGRTSRQAEVLERQLVDARTGELGF